LLALDSTESGAVLDLVGRPIMGNQDPPPPPRTACCRSANELIVTGLIACSIGAGAWRGPRLLKALSWGPFRRQLAPPEPLLCSQMADHRQAVR
jgi:hypothetical protein